MKNSVIAIPMIILLLLGIFIGIASLVQQVIAMPLHVQIILVLIIFGIVRIRKSFRA